MAMWDARGWVASLVGCDAGELTIRSTDTYGTETQVRYERGGQAVGKGHRAVTAQLGAGTYEVHRLAVPESDEIAY